MSAENAWKAVAAELSNAALQERWETGKPLDFRTLPMPPAFAEAVRAETDELRGMLAEVRGWLDPRRSREVAATCARIDALLSRLEAKGESHDAG